MSAEMESTLAAVHFDKVGQIAITVRDLERAKAFYRDTLGMKFLFDAGHLCFLQCGDIRFMIGTSEEAVGSSGTMVYFKVDDLERTHADRKSVV